MPTHLLIAVALGLAAPAPKVTPKADNPLVGTWELERATVFGAPIPDLKLTMTFTADGTYQSSGSQGKDTRAQSGTYARDPKPDPAHLDIHEPPGPGAAGGQTSLAIYKVEGDTLTICSGDATTRPSKFEAPGGAVQVLMVLKRVTAKD